MPEHIFISCDWGTSALRLRLVELPTLRVLAELNDGQGIATTFQSWKSAGMTESQRISFYRSILESGLRQLPFPSSLAGVPLIISGMASSSMGMKELPYKELPFAVNGTDLKAEILEPTDASPRRSLLVSGVRSETDVMRGEETQLVGCFIAPAAQFALDRLFLFPGTHSKHIRVRDGKAIGFTTYMTGEFFHLLTRHSILAGSIAEPTGDDMADGTDKAVSTAERSFLQGVLDSTNANLLHQIFRVRTHQLLGTMSKADNYHYLSGLLIGAECQDVKKTQLPLTLVAGGTLRDRYTLALKTIYDRQLVIEDIDGALIAAHASLCKSFLGN